MTLNAAKELAKQRGDKTGMSQLVYRSTLKDLSIDGGEFGLACTLPAHGVRVGNYYLANYTRPGWVDNADYALVMFMLVERQRAQAETV